MVHWSWLHEPDSGRHVLHVLPLTCNEHNVLLQSGGQRVLPV
jgi:hypothetical protein